VIGAGGAKTTTDPSYVPPPHGGGACISHRDCYPLPGATSRVDAAQLTGGKCREGVCSCVGDYTGSYCQVTPCVILFLCSSGCNLCFCYCFDSCTGRNSQPYRQWLRRQQTQLAKWLLDKLGVQQLQLLLNLNTNSSSSSSSSSQAQAQQPLPIHRLVINRWALIVTYGMTSNNIRRSSLEATAAAEVSQLQAGSRL
jgi:hypothetical protein